MVGHGCGRRFVGAANAALLVHAARSLLAFGIAWAWARELGEANAYDTLRGVAAGVSPAVLAVTATYLLAGTLVAPWLTMLWLHALAVAGSLHELAASARCSYATAARLGAAWLLATAGVCALSLGAFACCSHALRSLPNTQLRDLCALGAACVPALALPYLLALHDTARAATAFGADRMLPALQLGHAALGPAAIAWRVLASCTCLGLFALALREGPLLAQLLALAAACVRGLWLAYASERVAQRGEPQRRGSATRIAVTTEAADTR
jgi:hypothetical protein